MKLFARLTLPWMTVLLCAPALAKPIRVGLVLDKGGRDDKSFNSAAYQGAKKAQTELGIKLKYVEATDENAFEPLLRAFAQKEFDLIIGVGFSQKDAIQKIAPQFPKKHFVLIDSEVTQPNVRSLMFEEHEGSYVVGAIAALKSQSTKIGFIGGMDIPSIRRFALAYEAGAKHINPKIKVLTNFVGVTGDAWNNPAKAKELAAAQYATGADVVFAAAGASNNGIFDAAEERKKFAIGVDSNQNWIKPGVILTSMLKRVDVAVFNAVQDETKEKFTAGVQRFSLKDGGIDFAVDQFNSSILGEVIRRKANDLKGEIMAGKIAVPDYYKTQNK